MLEDAEAEKGREYRELAEKMGATFFAFAVETTGRLGQALAFIRLIIQEAARYKSVWAPKEVVHGIYRSVAMAVVRGNANVVQSNLLRSRLAEWRRWRAAGACRPCCRSRRARGRCPGKPR